MEFTAYTPKGNEVIINIETSAVSVPAANLNSTIKSVGRTMFEQDLLTYIDLPEGKIVLNKESGAQFNLARAAHKEAKLEAAIPGLKILRAAQQGEAKYFEAMQAMMEDENNDGANPPATLEMDAEQLATQYPRAALYLKADAYTNASHYAKAAAGSKAIAALENGESEEVASKILENWNASNCID